MTAYASKDSLTATVTRSEDFTLPSGAVVLIRPLTRGEAFRFAGKGLPVEVMEQKMIAMGIVEPSMTEADVKAWQATGDAGELQALSDKITELSGLTKGTAKEAMLDFRDE